MHDLSVIGLLAGALAVALVMGWVTQRLGLSTLVGYILAGIVVGPHTPGFVADARLAAQMAEIGVILLMFGVGLHFHPQELLRVWRIAVPGAVGQSFVAAVAGWGAARAMGWSHTAGIVFGMALAVASTVVLIRMLQQEDRLGSRDGHVAVGWLIVEDLFTVIALVVLPALATGTSPSQTGTAIALAIGKAGIFALVIWLAGTKLVAPFMEGGWARTRSTELFTLTVFVVALGIAIFAAEVFPHVGRAGRFLRRPRGGAVAHRAPGRRGTWRPSATCSPRSSSCRSGCSSIGGADRAARAPRLRDSDRARGEAGSSRSRSCSSCATRCAPRSPSPSGLAQIGDSRSSSRRSASRSHPPAGRHQPPRGDRDRLDRAEPAAFPRCRGSRARSLSAQRGTEGAAGRWPPSRPATSATPVVSGSRARPARDRAQLAAGTRVRRRRPPRALELSATRAWRGLRRRGARRGAQSRRRRGARVIVVTNPSLGEDDHLLAVRRSIRAPSIIATCRVAASAPGCANSAWHTSRTSTTNATTLVRAVRAHPFWELPMALNAAVETRDTSPRARLAILREHRCATARRKPRCGCRRNTIPADPRPRQAIPGVLRHGGLHGLGALRRLAME
jgi:hypothetical protein